MTGNTQSGGRFSVNYYQCYGLGHHFFILGSSHGKHFRYSGLVSQYSLLICTQWLFSVFGKLRSGGPSSVFALEARRKGRRFLFPFPRSLTFALSRSPKKITPDRRLRFWSTRLFVLVPRTSLFPQGVTKTMTVAIAWRTGAPFWRVFQGSTKRAWSARHVCLPLSPSTRTPASRLPPLPQKRRKK